MGVNEKGYRKPWSFRYKENCHGCLYDADGYCTKYLQKTEDRRLTGCSVYRPVKTKENK